MRKYIKRNSCDYAQDIIYNLFSSNISKCSKKSFYFYCLCVCVCVCVYLCHAQLKAEFYVFYIARCIYRVT